MSPNKTKSFPIKALSSSVFNQSYVTCVVMSSQFYASKARSSFCNVRIYRFSNAIPCVPQFAILLEDLGQYVIALCDLLMHAFQLGVVSRLAIFFQHFNALSYEVSFVSAIMQMFEHLMKVLGSGAVICLCAFWIVEFFFVEVPCLVHILKSLPGREALTSLALGGLGTQEEGPVDRLVLEVYAVLSTNQPAAPRHWPICLGAHASRIQSHYIVNGYVTWFISSVHLVNRTRALDSVSVVGEAASFAAIR